MIDIKIQDYKFGDTIVRYLIDKETKNVALQLIPQESLVKVVKHREILESPEVERTGEAADAWSIGSLVHIHLHHHSLPASQGMSLRYSTSTNNLKYVGQKQIEEEDRTLIKTILEADEGYRCFHDLILYHGESAFVVKTTFENTGQQDLMVDLLSSFSLDNLSPYQIEDGSGKLLLHRFRSGWSLEGRHVEETMEELHLERSWLGYFKESERFGQIGSQPVKRYFPFAAIEDKEANVLWGAQLAWNGSWQMEITRDKDCISLGGGLADREFGHWSKRIAPGQSFIAPPAYIAAVKGDIQDLTYRLTHLQHRAADSHPEVENNLPIVFNEWCTTWGKPTHEKLINIADRLQNSQVKYLIIDAGWSDNGSGQLGNGDWEVSPKAFPDGIKATAEAIRERGLIPGIWFEFEVTTEGARVYQSEYDDMHLKRNGIIINTAGWRTFWDFRKPETIDYLTEKVINFLRENKFGYLKVDYNGTTGYGCDGAESPGEGLRQHLVAVKDFFKRIRRELPELVIENCASGGHRLEPSMVGLTAISSFSDAHECPEIPLIAANVQNMILPRQSLIWAVL